MIKRIGQITFDNGDKDGHNYYHRARLLDALALVHFLSSLITSPRTRMLYDHLQRKDIQIWVGWAWKWLAGVAI